MFAKTGGRGQFLSTCESHFGLGVPERVLELQPVFPSPIEAVVSGCVGQRLGGLAWQFVARSADWWGEYPMYLVAFPVPLLCSQC